MNFNANENGEEKERKKWTLKIEHTSIRTTRNLWLYDETKEKDDKNKKTKQKSDI